jgi:hypothetical protein
MDKLAEAAKLLYCTIPVYALGLAFILWFFPFCAKYAIATERTNLVNVNKEKRAYIEKLSADTTTTPSGR